MFVKGRFNEFTSHSVAPRQEHSFFDRDESEMVLAPRVGARKDGHRGNAKPLVLEYGSDSGFRKKPKSISSARRASIMREVTEIERE